MRVFARSLPLGWLAPLHTSFLWLLQEGEGVSFDSLKALANGRLLVTPYSVASPSSPREDLLDSAAAALCPKPLPLKLSDSLRQSITK